MPGQQPLPTPASTPARATPHDTAPMPVNNRDMMHSSSLERDSNAQELDSDIIEFQDAASSQIQEPDKKSVKQNSSQNLKFSIDSILNKNGNKKVLHQILDQKDKSAFHPKNKEKGIMQNLQLTTSMDSNSNLQNTNQRHTYGGDIFSISQR